MVELWPLLRRMLIDVAAPAFKPTCRPWNRDDFRKRVQCVLWLPSVCYRCVVTMYIMRMRAGLLVRGRGLQSHSALVRCSVPDMAGSTLPWTP